MTGRALGGVGRDSPLVLGENDEDHRPTSPQATPILTPLPTQSAPSQTVTATPTPVPPAVITTIAPTAAPLVSPTNLPAPTAPPVSSTPVVNTSDTTRIFINSTSPQSFQIDSSSLKQGNIARPKAARGVSLPTGFSLSKEDFKVFVTKEGDQIVVKGQRSDGSEVEIDPEVLTQIKNRLAQNNIQFDSVQGSSVIERGNIKASTSLPLSINLANNRLIVTTVNGIRTVTVLPDTAVQAILNDQVVSRVQTQGDLIQVSLKDISGAPIYEIAGVSDKKILGSLAVRVNKQVWVSAENGQVVQIRENLLNRFLDLISR